MPSLDRLYSFSHMEARPKLKPSHQRCMEMLCFMLLGALLSLALACQSLRDHGFLFNEMKKRREGGVSFRH